MPDEYVTKYDLNAVDKRLSAEAKENRDRIDEHTQKISKLESLYESLEELPATMASLDKTISLIGNNLSSMDKNIEEVKADVLAQSETIAEMRKEHTEMHEEIEEVDNKSKVDWAVFITNNFWKIVAVCGIIYIVAKEIIGKVA